MIKVKYSPQKSTIDTIIKYVSETTINIDDQDYEFPDTYLTFPNVLTDSNGVVLEAHYTNGVLYITILRKYSEKCSDWDTGDYQEVIK